MGAVKPALSAIGVPHGAKLCGKGDPAGSLTRKARLTCQGGSCPDLRDSGPGAVTVYGRVFRFGMFLCGDRADPLPSSSNPSEHLVLGVSHSMHLGMLATQLSDRDAFHVTAKEPADIPLATSVRPQHLWDSARMSRPP